MVLLPPLYQEIQSLIKFKKSRPDYPGGVIGVYDNKQKTIDRYSVVFKPFQSEGLFYFPTLMFSATPEGPYGCSHYNEYTFRPTRLKGEVVLNWSELPENCRNFVSNQMGEKL